MRERERGGERGRERREGGSTYRQCVQIYKATLNFLTTAYACMWVYLCVCLHDGHSHAVRCVQSTGVQSLQSTVLGQPESAPFIHPFSLGGLTCPNASSLSL